MRTRTSFQKRQKEIARAEKQRDKIARRQQKKLVAKQPGAEPQELNNAPDSNSEPDPVAGQ
jgi:hypothetical protein